MKVTSVPFYRLNISKQEIEKVSETMRSGWLTTGKVTHQFEIEFADYVGAKYALAVNSCTAALHLSLIVAGVKPGDEVITTPYTFVATTETIIQCGARVVFVDTEGDSFNIDLRKIEAAVTPRTRAIVPVYIAGYPSDLNVIDVLRRKHKVSVIHDAAHALGTISGSSMVGATPDLTCFSFYSTKNLTTGEGGMITTDNKKQMELLRVISLHGMSRDAWKRYTGTGSWKYQIRELGYKYNLSDMASSLGLVQLHNFDKMQKSRKRAAALYAKYLGEVDELVVPNEPENGRHAWHLYIVKLRKGGEAIRDRVIEELKGMGVGTSVHFIPLYLHPYYKKNYGHTRHDFPNSYNHYCRAITLPLFVDITEDEIKYVADCFKKIFTRSRKK